MNKPIDNDVTIVETDAVDKGVVEKGVSLIHTLKIEADQIGSDPVALTHRPGSESPLEYNDKYINEISVDFTENSSVNHVIITVELEGDPANYFKTPLLTDQKGENEVKYPGITGNIVSGNNRKVELTCTAHEMIEVVVYKALWLNTNKGPFDPTVIIKK